MFRLLQHSGVYPDYTKEPSDIACGRKNVESVTLLLSKWWGSGIVHAKVWISDLRHVYIGSANNDWKSLTQVSYFIKHLIAHLSILPWATEVVILIQNTNCIINTKSSFLWLYILRRVNVDLVPFMIDCCPSVASLLGFPKLFHRTKFYIFQGSLWSFSWIFNF